MNEDRSPIPASPANGHAVPNVHRVTGLDVPFSERTIPTLPSKPHKGRHKRTLITGGVKEAQSWPDTPMGYFDRTPVRFRYILLVALTTATVFTLQKYMLHVLYMEAIPLPFFNWIQRATPPFTTYLTWALLTPLLYTWFLKWPVSERPIIRTIARYFIMGVAISALNSVIATILHYSVLSIVGYFHITDPLHRAWVIKAFLPDVALRFMEFWVVLGILVALDNARRRKEDRTKLVEMEHQLQNVQHDALKKQLQPHFLFNTLNTVSSLMEENVEAARTMLDQLALLLRTSLNRERRDRVPLEQEVEHAASYLGIQAMRFNDRLHVRYDIHHDCEGALVPSMLIQPLVENSLKHGFKLPGSRMSIVVAAHRHHDDLVLRVIDNGSGCPDTEAIAERPGIGLRNVRERLRLLYGPKGRMEIVSPSGGGFEVVLSLPFSEE